MIKHFKNLLNSLKVEENSPEAKHTVEQACAVLLYEVASADFEQSSVEKQKIVELLRTKFSLSDDEVQELTEKSHSDSSESVSVYPFTTLINKEYDNEQKVHLIDLMWQVAYADGNLDKYEDSLIRKIADLLYISHSDFIKTKLKHAESE